MSNPAFLMMLVTEVLITCITIYFFYRVFTSKDDLNTGIKDP